MELADLEKWISSENVARFRDRLADPRYEALHGQLQGMLDRELAKIQTAFPNKSFQPLGVLVAHDVGRL